MAGVHAIMGSKVAGAAVFLKDSNAYNYAFAPNDAFASYDVTSGGLVYSSAESTYTWKLSGAGADYEIKVDIVSGAVTVGSSATGSWLSLGSSRAWACTETSNVGGSQTTVLTVSIRRASDGVVIATCTATLQAVVEI